MFVGPWNFKGKHPYGILFNLQKEKYLPANEYIRPDDVIASYFFLILQSPTLRFVYFKKEAAVTK